MDKQGQGSLETEGHEDRESAASAFATGYRLGYREASTANTRRPHVPEPIWPRLSFWERVKRLVSEGPRIDSHALQIGTVPLATYLRINCPVCGGKTFPYCCSAGAQAGRAVEYVWEVHSERGRCLRVGEDD